MQERALLRTWLLGAHAAQVALGLTMLLGLLVFPPIRDAAVDAVFPASQSRGGFLGLRRRVEEHPLADPTRALLTGMFWIGGLGATATLLLRQAPSVARRGREDAPAPVAASAPGTASFALERTMVPAEPSTSTSGVAATQLAGADRSAHPAGAVPETAASPGATAGGRYRIEQELGRGGVGVVYRAWDTVLERPVALKELPPRLVRDPQLAERFRIEARVLARLSHPGMVQVFDLVESDAGMWIAMELVTGGSLDDVLERRGPLPLDEVLRLGADMADALAHAHAQEVVHRDFKPHNVLLTPDGRPKITDFGLAKIAREGPKLTQAGAIMGSPSYMSPEQACGGDTDHRADAYAFGITLYQMLVGRCPFDGDTASVLAAHITQPPPDPAELGVPIPGALGALLSALLAKRPEDRPPDLAAVASDLRSGALRETAGA